MQLYMNPISTTCRMITMFAASEGISLDTVLIDLMNGEQRQPEYLKINPNGLVPLLEDDGFYLSESGAILRYLAAKANSSAYPTNIQERARVDEAMEWFYSNFYKDIGYGLVYPQILPHHKRPTAESQNVTVTWARAKSEHWLGILDKNMIGTDNRYIYGDRITLADYVGAEMVGLGELIQCEYRDFPNVQRWMATMKDLPKWHETHAAYDGFVNSLRGGSFVSV